MMWFFVLLAPLAAVMGIVVYVWIRYYPAATQGAKRVAPLPPAPKCAKRADGESCEFETTDGVTLRGTYIACKRPQRLGVLVFCHPLFASRWAVSDHLDALRRGGFDVFTFDFRNHGTSDRTENYNPRPNLARHELADLTAAIDYVTSRPDADPNGVALMGMSKGGAAALHVATVDGRVWSVVADSAFSVDWVTAYYFRRYVGIFVPLLSAVVRKMPWFLYIGYARFIQARVARELGVDVSDLLDVVDNVKLPVFLIQGGRDQYVPVEMARTLKRRIGKQCKLWVVQKANHNESIHRAREKYEDRMVRFLVKNSGNEAWAPATLPIDPRPIDPLPVTPTAQDTPTFRGAAS
ncbi:MAG: alpha/beta fold hydrolase [Pirellulales bacterium]